MIDFRDGKLSVWAIFVGVVHVDIWQPWASKHAVR